MSRFRNHLKWWAIPPPIIMDRSVAMVMQNYFNFIASKYLLIMKDNTIALVLLCLWIITSCQVKSDNANQNDNGKSELIINQEANQINLTTLKFINQTFDFGNVDKD